MRRSETTTAAVHNIQSVCGVVAGECMYVCACVCWCASVGGIDFYNNKKKRQHI